MNNGRSAATGKEKEASRNREHKLTAPYKDKIARSGNSVKAVNPDEAARQRPAPAKKRSGLAAAS